VQIVVKTTHGDDEDLAPMIRSMIAAVSPGTDEAIQVAKVFPQATTGNRSRMYAVNLPESVSREQAGNIAKELAHHQELEYAEIAAEKRPLSD
jgi:hypothetical protein